MNHHHILYFYSELCLSGQGGINEFNWSLVIGRHFFKSLICFKSKYSIHDTQAEKSRVSHSLHNVDVGQAK